MCSKMGSSELIMIDIDEIIELININNSEEKQRKGLEYASKVKCLRVFLRPRYPYGEEVWENCAKILASRSDCELRPCLHELLYWIQDFSIPGSHIIFERLKKMNDILGLKDSLKEAKASGNKVWLENLNILEKSTRENKIDEKYLLELLDSNASPSSQAKGRELGKSIGDLSIFIAPPNYENSWENCAKILCEQSDDKLAYYLWPVWNWIKHENCPKILIDRLKSLENYVFNLSYIDMFITIAQDEQDTKWEEKLRSIKEAIQNNNRKHEYFVNIDYIIDSLRWDQSPEKQEEGLQLGKKVKNFNTFIFPHNAFCGKDVWEGCAQILYEKTDKELSYYLMELLECIQDLTWPGATIIFERLQKYSADDKLKEALKESLNKAKIIEDEPWEENLWELFI